MYICIWILRTLIEPLRKLLNKEYIMHMQKNCCSMNCAMHISISQKIYPINKSQHGLNTPWKLWSFRTRLSHSRKESWDTNETVPFICHGFSSRSWFYANIDFPDKSRKKNYNGHFIRRIYILSTKRDWLTVISCFFFLFRCPLHALPFSNHLSRSLCPFSYFLSLFLSDFTELTVGWAHLACNFQNVE